MNTIFERLLFNLGKNPPPNARAEALRLRAIFQALPSEEQVAIRKANSNYPYLKAARVYLPHVKLTRATTYEVLLNSESEGWQVAVAWAYLDKGLPDYAVKEVLLKAKKRFRDARHPEFSTHLQRLLERVWNKRQARALKLAKNSPENERQSLRRIARPAQQRATAPQTTKSEEGQPVSKSAIMSAYPEPHRHLIAAGASKFNTNPDRLLLDVFENWAASTLGLTVRAERPPAPAPAVKPQAKAAAPKPKAAAVKPKPTQAPVKANEDPKQDIKMPPLHERLKIVMGNDKCTIPDCIDRLRARAPGWLPESTELRAYISLALSTHTKDLFERVKRGVYRVKSNANGPKGPNGSGTNGNGSKGPNGSGSSGNSKGPKSSNGAGAREDFEKITDNPFAAAS